MSSDISYRWLKIHSFDNIVETGKYIIDKCNYCDIYKVTYKIYNIKCKFKYNELPSNILSQIERGVSLY